MTAQQTGVELLLIRSEPPCRRCHQTEAVLRAVADQQVQAGGVVAVRVITSREPEAARYGAVLTPMVVLNGKIVCAGIVPTASGLAKLIRAEVAGGACPPG